MRKTLVLATLAAMSLSVSAFAQSEGSPGAAPGGTGSNPSGAGVQTEPMTTDKMHEGRAAAPDQTTHRPTAEPTGDKNGNNMTGGNGQ